jgi:hypothetical protein
MKSNDVKLPSAPDTTRIIGEAEGRTDTTAVVDAESLSKQQAMFDTVADVDNEVVYPDLNQLKARRRIVVAYVFRARTDEHTKV